MVLDGKVALVTGSSRGIGLAIAACFAQHGARVALHGRDVASLQRVEAEIAGAGGRVMSVTAELTRFEEVERMRRRIESELGVVDVLVANAGGSHTPPSAFEEITEDGWHASLAGNLTATFLTLKSFLPPMKARGSGSIVTLSSSAARRPTARTPAAYAAAKAGIEQLTRQLAAEAGAAGIRVNCIAPETILTERNLQWIDETQRESLAAAHPLRRLGTPRDVADAALFLASDASSWITGHILDVTGGGMMP